jgi:hypothetical protein
MGGHLEHNDVLHRRRLLMRGQREMRVPRNGGTNQEGDADVTQTACPRRDLESLRRRFALAAAPVVVGLGLAAAVASAGSRPTGVLFGRMLLAVRDDQALQGHCEFADVATCRE